MRISVHSRALTDAGESYLRHFGGADSGFPRSKTEAFERSVKSLRLCFPSSIKRIDLSKAAVTEEDGRWLVEGKNWTVDWRTDARVSAEAKLVADLSSDETQDLGPFVVAVAKLSATKSKALIKE